MKLIDNWRKAWRMFSVQALAAIAVLPVVWAQLPLDVQNMIPVEYRPWVLLAVAVGGLAGRLVDQEKAK